MPNMAQCATATKQASKVKILNMPALHVGSEIPSSNGGEPGVQKGMVSPMQLSKTAFKMGSQIVKIEGQPAVKLLSMTAQNGANPNAPVGMQNAPSQAVVMIGM
jgi:hypothetical protein